MYQKKAVSDLDRRVAALIRARRNELRVSQQSVADAVGVSCQQMQKYECGEDRITIGRLSLIAQSLKLNPVSLFQSEDVNNGLSVASLEGMEILRDKELMRAAQGLSLLDKPVRSQIVRLIEVLHKDKEEESYRY